MTPPKGRPQIVRRRAAAGAPPQTDDATAPHPFDQRFGTETGGLLPGAQISTGDSADRYVTAYYAIAPSIFRSLLELWQQQCAPPFSLDQYTLVDIGSGKGRAMLLAAENPFVAVWAVERHPGLTQIAEENVRRAMSMRSAGLQPFDPLAPIRIINADALSLRLPDTPTLLFLFHPFEAPGMRRLLRSVSAQFANRARQLDLLYVNAEHSSVLDRDPHFARLWSGRVPMSTEDHLADLREIENQQEYGSTGDELCAVYRFVGAPGANSSEETPGGLSRARPPRKSSSGPERPSTPD